MSSHQTLDLRLQALDFRLELNVITQDCRLKLSAAVIFRLELNAAEICFSTEDCCTLSNNMRTALLIINHPHTCTHTHTDTHPYIHTHTVPSLMLVF